MRKNFLILAFAALSLLCSCSGSNEPPDVERTALSVEIYDRDNIPAGAGTITDNVMTRWIQSEFGDKNNIDVRFVPVKRNAESELVVMIASGDAPDILYSYSYDTLDQFLNQNLLCDLTEYLKDADALRSFLGSDFLDQRKVGDKQYFIPAKRLISGRQSQLIRKDWLDKLGLDVPQTTDEFYNVLKAFKKYDPGNNGENNIPYGLSNNEANYLDLVYSFLSVDYDDRDMNCAFLMQDPGYKDGIRFMNKLYNEGLMSKDFVFDKTRKKFESDIAEGYVGFFCDDLGRQLQFGAAYEKLLRKNPDASYAACDTWTSRDGSRKKCVYDSEAMYVAVPKTCSHPENAIKYLDWMCDPDVLMTLQYGFEGVSYELDGNGVPTVIESPESRITHWYTLGFDLSIIVNGKYCKDSEKILEFNANATVDPKLYIDCYNQSVRDGWVSRHFRSPKSAFKDSARVNELCNKIIKNSIICSPQDFDSVFDDALNELKNYNVEEIYRERYEIYDELY